jgi:hypothetical protein
MFKKLFLFLFITAPALADYVMINPEVINNKTEDVLLLCLENRHYYVANVTQETITEVNMPFSDALFRTLRTQDDIEDFLKVGGRITLKQCSNGDYIVNVGMPLRGGGPVAGAWCWLGYQVVCFTALFSGTIAVNAALPGIGGIATTLAVGGSWTTAIAAIQAGSVKAFAFGCALPCP